MKTWKLAMVAALACLAACGTIEQYQTPVQPIGKLQTAGIGDVVLRLNKSRSLTNAFGGADVWGRRSDLGYTEVRYLGVDPDGSLVFSRREVDIMTNETTVSRAGFIPIPTSSRTYSSGTVSGTVGNTAVHGNYDGNSTTYGTAFVPTRKADTIMVPPGEIAIRVPNDSRRVRVSGYHLKIMEAVEDRIDYVVLPAPAAQ